MGDDANGKSGPVGDKTVDVAPGSNGREPDGPEHLNVGSLIFGPVQIGKSKPMPSKVGQRGKRRPVIDFSENPFPPWQDSFTTTEAALYCRFRTPQGLRKAWYSMEVFPYGRRGGRHTLMWNRKELDRFLRGEPLKSRKAAGLLLPPKHDAKDEVGP